MTISEYIVKHMKGNNSAFARLIGVHPSTAMRWIDGDKFPHRYHAKLIVERTKDKISMTDIYG